jgi:hypothetical protein
MSSTKPSERKIAPALCPFIKTQSNSMPMSVAMGKKSLGSRPCASIQTSRRSLFRVLRSGKKSVTQLVNSSPKGGDRTGLAMGCRSQVPRVRAGVFDSWQGIVLQALGVPGARLGTPILQGLVWLSKPQPSQAGGRSGPDAQASSGQPADVSEASYNQRRDRRAQLENPEPQIRRPRLPQLSQLPDSDPVLP